MIMSRGKTTWVIDAPDFEHNPEYKVNHVVRELTYGERWNLNHSAGEYASEIKALKTYQRRLIIALKEVGLRVEEIERTVNGN